MYYLCIVQLKHHDYETYRERRGIDSAIRNYRKSYPNGYPELLEYAERLFEKLVSPFDEEY